MWASTGRVSCRTTSSSIACLREEQRLREEGANIRGVVLEHEFKREYQQWLQEHNRGRADSDGRPDRDPREVEEWARDHDLPYFDESVLFPDSASITKCTEASGTRSVKWSW